MAWTGRGQGKDTRDQCVIGKVAEIRGNMALRKVT